LLTATQKINLYIPADENISTAKPYTQVDTGKIILNTGLMEGNSLIKGDVIKLCDKEFEFAGDFERPDYLFPIKDTTDTYAMKNEFGIGIISDAEFEELAELIDDKKNAETDEKINGDANEESDNQIVKEYYVIRYNKDNENEVRKHINEDYELLSYLKADVNTRINTPKTEMTQTANLMNIVILMLVIFIAVIIAVVIGRKIKNDRRQKTDRDSL
jgi:hypothetical protein